MMLIIEKLFLGDFLKKLPKFISRIYVLLIVMLSFIIFNGESFVQIGQNIGGLVGTGEIPLVSKESIYYLKSYLVVILVGIVGSTPMLVISMVLLLINVAMFISQSLNNVELFYNVMRYLVPTLLLPIGTALIALILEKKPIKPMIKGLLCYPAFMGTWVLINIKCLFKRETTWQKIEHVRSIKIAEVKEVPEKI